MLKLVPVCRGVHLLTARLAASVSSPSAVPPTASVWKGWTPATTSCERPQLGACRDQQLVCRAQLSEPSRGCAWVLRRPRKCSEPGLTLSLNRCLNRLCSCALYPEGWGLSGSVHTARVGVDPLPHGWCLYANAQQCHWCMPFQGTRCGSCSDTPSTMPKLRS